MATNGLPPRRGRGGPAPLLVPPLLTLGVPEALPPRLPHPAAAQTAGAPHAPVGAAGGDRSKGYYSCDVGSWHLIALNSTCAAAGGCSRGTPQEQWLKSDLAATRAHCIIAFWHHPRFFTPSRAPGIAHIDTIDRKMSTMWADLQAAGAGS